MRLKRQRQHLKAARTASIESFIIRKLEASSLPKSAQPQIDDDKLSTDNTSDTEGEFAIWFWNESVNEIDVHCGSKKWARENCQYTLDNLRRRVPRALASVFNKTILAYYHRCRKKMALYEEGILYGSSNWKARTAHHKPTNKDDDR